jgi:hypothetical protein
MLCVLAEVYDELGDLGGAERLYPQLAPHRGLNAVGPLLEYQGSVAYFLGILACTLGKHGEALEHLSHAEQVNQRLSMPFQLAKTRALRERVAGRRSAETSC